MGTTNSMAVNSSNHSYIGMVSNISILNKSAILQHDFRFFELYFFFFKKCIILYILFTTIPDHSNHDKEAGKPLPEEKIFKDDELVNMIDPILATDDKNGDGFIDYKEFVLAQQAAATRADH